MDRLSRRLNDQEDICNHDVVTFVDGVAGDIKQASRRRPGIAANYAKVLAVGTQRRLAISDGIARKKSEQAAKEADGNATPTKGEKGDKSARSEQDAKSESPALKTTDDVKTSA